MPEAHSRAGAERFGALTTMMCGQAGISVSDRRGFTRGALMAQGKLFAALHGEQLLLKLPAAHVTALVAAGDGAPFDAGKGRPMKEWVLIPATGDWERLAAAAAAFVAGAGAR